MVLPTIPRNPPKEDNKHPEHVKISMSGIEAMRKQIKLQQQGFMK